MGGTSTDISVIVDGAILEMSQGQIAGQDIGTPMLRVRTLGAGGGTVAEIGKDGLLKVGPRSSGSVPGPACYGRGGTEATVTDANLLLGALSGETLLAGTLRLDEAAARAALERTGAALGMDALQTAAGIIRIVNTHMAVDMRLALQEQGQDPRSFRAGRLRRRGAAARRNAWRAASEFRPCWCRSIPASIARSACCRPACAIPISARRSARSRASRVDRVNELFAALEAQAMQEANEEGFAPSQVKITRLLDLRYPHQGYSLCVPCPAPFDEAARRASSTRSIRCIRTSMARARRTRMPTSSPSACNRRSRCRASRCLSCRAPTARPARAIKGQRPLYDTAQQKFERVNVWDRAKLLAGDRFEGPAVIEQFDSTTVVLRRPDGQRRDRRHAGHRGAEAQS